METPPPKYQKCLGTLAIVPREGKSGNVGTGADFDTKEITARLERLEATLDRIEVTILAGNASKQTSGCRCSLRRFCRRFRSAPVERRRSRVAERLVFRVADSIDRFCLRGRAWCDESCAWCSRSKASLIEFKAKSTDDPAHKASLTANAAEERRYAERFKETAMYLRECVKNPGTYEESKMLELYPTYRHSRISCKSTLTTTT